MRIAFLLASCLWLTAGCTTPLKEPDYATPKETLLFFHEAFKRKEIEKEYECFSHAFKQAHNKMDLKSYYELRRQLAEEYPVTVFFFSLQDLEDNIVGDDCTPGSDTASLKLMLCGEEFIVDFIRETMYRLEFDEGRSVEDLTEMPLHRLLFMGEDQFEVTLPLSSRTKKSIHTLKKILVEKRWKILDFPSLESNNPVSG